jgi:hypothetical protein
MLRRQGLDAAVITTTAFRALAKMTAVALGDPELTLITLEHPLGGIDDAALGTRAQTAADQIGTWRGEVAARRAR